MNSGYYPRMSYKGEDNPSPQSKSADKLSEELKELIVVCYENPHHAQKLQKQAHNKEVKLKSFALDEKIWLNSKYIKIKWNSKIEAKFFGPF